MKDIIKSKTIDRCIITSTDKIRQTIRHVNGEIGWHQHLQSKKVGIVATAIGLLLLNRQKQAIKDEDQAFDFIAKSQNIDGGWAYISNLPDKSNTESTCWALKALNIRKNIYTQEIENGIKWLLGKIDLTLQQDSGWGFVGTMYPRVYNTCLVLRTLTEFNLDHNEEFESGLQWLRNCQNPDGGWGETNGSESSIFYTAYTINSLINCDILHTDEIILKAITWLESKINDIGIKSPSVLCTFEFIEENTDGKKSRTPFFHFTIPHIIQAFISTGNSSKRIVFDGIKELLKSNQHGYWKHPFLEHSRLIPIWAIYDSIELLQTFKDLYRDWNDIHHFRMWYKKIRKIHKYSPVRIWDKINTQYLYFILTVLFLGLVIRYSIAIYERYPIWFSSKSWYFEFGLSVFASLIASTIIYILNPILRYMWKRG